MPKDELLEFQGIVVEVLPNAMFRVRLDNEHEVLAHSSGRMRKNRIRVLAGEGIVETSPHRGARIVAVDADFIRNTYDMREALEGMLAERCAERATPAARAEMRRLVEAHAAAVATGARERIVALDRALHLTLAEAAANPPARRALVLGRGLIEALRLKAGFSATRLARIVHEHHELIEAIEARDARTAGLVARLHVIGARDDLLRALAGEGPG